VFSVDEISRNGGIALVKAEEVPLGAQLEVMSSDGSRSYYYLVKNEGSG
jgi:hypothetical protein